MMSCEGNYFFGKRGFTKGGTFVQMLKFLHKKTGPAWAPFYI